MEKIHFINSFVKIFGFQNIADYKTKISITDSNPNLNSINSHMDFIKNHFNTSQLQLSRINFFITTKTQAVSLLKNILKQSNIPYESIKSNSHTFLRLIPINTLLSEYINSMSADIVTEVKNVRWEEIERDIREKNVEIVSSKKDGFDMIYSLVKTKKKYISSKMESIVENFQIGIYEGNFYYEFSPNKFYDFFYDVSLFLIDDSSIIIKEFKELKIMAEGMIFNYEKDKYYPMCFNSLKILAKIDKEDIDKSSKMLYIFRGGVADSGEREQIMNHSTSFYEKGKKLEISDDSYKVKEKMVLVSDKYIFWEGGGNMCDFEFFVSDLNFNRMDKLSGVEINFGGEKIFFKDLQLKAKLGSEFNFYLKEPLKENEYIFIKYING